MDREEALKEVLETVKNIWTDIKSIVDYVKEALKLPQMGITQEELDEEFKEVTNNLEWLNRLEKEDLIEMITEIVDTLRKDYEAPAEDIIAQLQSSVYEWHESYLAMESSTLAPITDPNRDKSKRILMTTP